MLNNTVCVNPCCHRGFDVLSWKEVFFPRWLNGIWQCFGKDRTVKLIFKLFLFQKGFKLKFETELETELKRKELKWILMFLDFYQMFSDYALSYWKMVLQKSVFPDTFADMQKQFMHPA